jgi:hypothetical protein
VGMGLQTGLIAFIADLLAVNRNLMEEVRYDMNKNCLLNDLTKLDNSVVKK